MDFYITLPASDASNRGNTSARFITRLPETLKLTKGRHVIGLTQLIYPVSYFNVHTDMTYSITEPDGRETFVTIPAGHYTTPESIITTLNSNPLTHGIQFIYEDQQQRIRLQLNSLIHHVYFEPALAYFLGFDTENHYESVMAARPVDYTNNINTMYVYCDAVDYSIVGSQKSNLLQCIPTATPHDFGKMENYSFNPVRYIPIASEFIDSIAVDIMDEFGRPFKFNFGSTVLTLHVKSLY